jgi:SAM-dependent methyltransferase
VHGFDGTDMGIAGRIRRVLANHGSAGLVRLVRSRILPPRAHCSSLCAELVHGRTGLEIGGPSEIFSPRGLLRLYPLVGSLDNCNFGSTTVWEGRIREGLTFQYHPGRPFGRQYIDEASDLKGIADGTYDFVLSSHTLEHTANPLRALEEWLRVLRPDGTLLLVVPHRDGTFDHRRPVTGLAHLLDDWRRGTTEQDLTHLPEILALHDLARDPQAGGREAFVLRSQANAESRCLHHHVFDTALAVEIVNQVSLQILAVEALWPFHVLVVAKKLPDGTKPGNDPFLQPAAPHFRRSPFRTDRQR